jgi:hypothetical protein
LKKLVALLDFETEKIYSLEEVLRVLNQLQQDSKFNKIDASILEAFPLYI